MAMAGKLLANKVAIITGSTKGIGFAIAKKLALEGATVVVSSRRQENVTTAIAELKKENLPHLGVACHVGKEEDRKNLIEQTIKKFGKIDILVSNVAVSPHFGLTIGITEKQIDKIFDVNVKSSFLIARDCYPYLKATKGNITFVTSIGAYKPFVGGGWYSISKTSLLALTRVMASELAVDGIRVNCIAPGLIKTDFSKGLTENETIRNKFLEEIPLGRLGQPDDCAGAVVFLSCDQLSSYVTGECISMTGGIQSRL
ncbi:hypothetical protein LOD99_11667 [Oopsacas minuta]|uniref:Dehydrogenase/reductase SDR family member 4 n=1 Tax=Oopsacas minuta TaxID=111878 RepID=A0AAV7JLG8_9METZ|nr:hypothetical protein LOD99_11667 [Oopsacas minuta]